MAGTFPITVFMCVKVKYVLTGLCDPGVRFAFVVKTSLTAEVLEKLMRFASDHRDYLFKNTHIKDK